MTVVRLETGADLRLGNEQAPAAAVFVNGGTARVVPGTWSATSELLANELAPRFPELAFGELRYRLKTWHALDSCMDDARAALDLLGRPTLLVGFSMGGAVSIGVAAHEAGHALQHKAAYAPLHIRMALVPLTQFATQASFFLFFGGLFLGFAKLIFLALLIYGVFAVFQLVTLPVEYDASRRAKEQLVRAGIVTQHEAPAVNKVLNAAALTYVAALVSAVLTFLYYLSVFRGSNRN